MIVRDYKTHKTTMTILYDTRLSEAFDHLPEEIDETFDLRNERQLLATYDWRSPRHRRSEPIFFSTLPSRESR